MLESPHDLIGILTVRENERLLVYSSSATERLISVAMPVDWGVPLRLPFDVLSSNQSGAFSMLKDR